MYLDAEGLDFETCTRTLQRFMMTCVLFYIENSRDLIDECFDDFTQKAKQIMGVDGKLMRIDSMMIDCNARILTRLELIYTVVSDMVLEIAGVNKKRPRPEYRKIPFCNNTIKGQLSLDDLGKSEEYLPAYDKEDPVPAETDSADSSSENDDEVVIIKAQSESASVKSWRKTARICRNSSITTFSGMTTTASSITIRTTAAMTR